MLRFITSLLLIVSSLLVNAQMFDKLEDGKDKYFRISVDPTVSLNTFMQAATIGGFDATIDSEVKKNLFLVGATGVNTYKYDEGQHIYSSNGAFVSLGADMNLTEQPTLSDRDIFFVGLHYGFAAFSQEVQNLIISNPFGDYNLSVPSEAVTAGWLQLSFGIKAEFATNFFVGWTAEAKLRTHLKEATTETYYIPGYGKNGENSYNLGLNIFLGYAFTFKAKNKSLPEVIK